MANLLTEQLNTTAHLGRNGSADLDSAEVMALEKHSIIQTYKRAPFVLERGEGMYVYDTDGNAYLDFVAGIAVMALGHSDPGVIAAINEQAAKLIHTSNLYYTEPGVRLAAKLVEMSFADRVFFSNSGTEANEAAIKFARKYARVNSDNPNKTRIVAFDHAFHGRTMGSLAMTPKEAYQQPFRPLMPDVVIAPFNQVDGLEAIIDENTCAVFIEPIQGEGGVHPAHFEFLTKLRSLCDAVGALLIFDEVQCGLGRTGDIWAHSASGITPDVMTLAKPLASGLPIGAVLVKQKVADALKPGDHGSTFAGGPLACHVGEYVLGRICQPTFLAHVNNMGTYLKERLSEINSPHIKEVRGRGLIVGIELDIDASPIVEKALDHHLLLVNAGPNVVRIIPPLIVEQKHIDVLAETLTTILAES
jgi:predicted acetylornithine/succinylornithine family transaminase